MSLNKGVATKILLIGIIVLGIFISGVFIEDFVLKSQAPEKKKTSKIRSKPLFNPRK